MKKTREKAIENLITETRSLSEKAQKTLPPLMTDFEKRNALLMASYEKMVMSLFSQNFELRMIQDSLYYHWVFPRSPSPWRSSVLGGR